MTNNTSDSLISHERVRVGADVEKTVAQEKAASKNASTSSGTTSNTSSSRRQNHIETPWVNVHELAESVFCRRAGVIAYESDQIDTGSEFDPVLDFLPMYDAQEMRDALEQTWQRIWRFIAGAVPASVVTWMAVVRYGPLVSVAVFVTCVPLFCWLSNQFRVVIWLGRCLQKQSDAIAAEPSLAGSETQSVNWWSLLKSGFEPVQYVEPHADDMFRLVGKPWRILQKGSLRIPVFRIRQDRTRLHGQHYLRIAAYCHLVRTAESAQVPYGVILCANGYDGIAVAASEADHRKITHALRDARKVLARLKNQFAPEPPKNPARCRRCPHARPQLYQFDSATFLGGKEYEPVTRRQPDGKYYHCTCGDRFKWIPPQT